MVVGSVLIGFWGSFGCCFYVRFELQVAAVLFRNGSRRRQRIYWVWGRVFGGFCELKACSLHGLCSGVEEEGEWLGKMNGDFGLRRLAGIQGVE